MPYYISKTNEGLKDVAHSGDGTSITLQWFRAFPTVKTNKIAYNIYIDQPRPDFEFEFFHKSPAYVSTDGSLQVAIEGLEPGVMYRFAVRAAEYDPADTEFSHLPVAFNGLRTYPESLLVSNITAISTVIPLVDVSGFPASGVVKIGAENIQYSSINSGLNELILTSVPLQRGFNDTDPAIHTTDGYDGYVSWAFAGALYWPMSSEEQNTVVYATENKFDVDQYAFTNADGYRQATEDIINSDLGAVDTDNEDFPSYDYAGFHRTDPVAMLAGDCVGSYFGGELGCYDGYSGSTPIRGISVQDRNTQRQEELLSMTGEPVVLVKRQWQGIRCSCILPHQESPEARCKRCYGTGFVLGFNQIWSDRRNDGRIMMRFDPWIDDNTYIDAGIDTETTKPNAWTIVIPSIHKRDFIVRYDTANNEETRYEVINVTRNVLFNQQFGAQHMVLQRIRKTDIIYQYPVMSNIGMFPTLIDTTFASSNGIASHKHSFESNENVPVSSWNQVSTISAGHSHKISVIDGVLVVSTELGHTHQIIL